MNFRLTPDGGRYLSMAHGKAEPLPFHTRWLLPALCRDKIQAWLYVSFASITAAIILTGILALQHGANPKQAIVAALLIAGLPWLRFCAHVPVLVDMPALALALGCGVLWPIEPVAALGLCLFGACVCEKIPVMAAVFAWSPWLLIGALSPAIRLAISNPGEVDVRDQASWALAHPLAAGLKSHAKQWRDPRMMLLPWGVCLIILAAQPSLWLIAALVIGYGQLFLVTDSVREYQLLAPIVCVTAAMMIPEQWAIPAVIAHWFNPWGGDGL